MSGKSKRPIRAVTAAWLVSFIASSAAWGVQLATQEYEVVLEQGPNGEQLTGPYAYGPAFTPDGSGVAYVVRDRHNRTELQVAALDGTVIAVLPGGPNSHFTDTAAAVSPDGKRIAYVAEADPEAEVYGREDTRDPGLYVANADGSDAKRITSIATWEYSYSVFYDVAFSPDGLRIAYTDADPVHPDDAERAPDPERDSGPSRSIYTIGVDGADRKRVSRGDGNEYSPAFSPDGKRIVFSQDGILSLMDADGTSRRLLSGKRLVGRNPAFSPGGERIVYVDGADTGFSDVFVIDVDGTKPRRLTANRSVDAAPVFSPDGRSIAFASARTGLLEIYLMDADGTNVRRLTHVSHTEGPR